MLFKHYYRLIIIGCGLMIFQQLSGIVITLQYGPALIEIAGFETDQVPKETAAVVLSLPLSFVRMLGTIISLQVIDTRGRRATLLKTLPILIVTMLLMGGSIALFNNATQNVLVILGKWLTLALMIVFLFSYSVGLEFIPWLINSEIYPLFLIGSASALSAFSHWITCFIIASCFDQTRVVALIEFGAFCNFFCFIFVQSVPLGALTDLSPDPWRAVLIICTHVLLQY